jgi:hypothetical protein
MTKEQLAETMKRHELTAEQLGDLVGRRERIVQLWLDGKHPTPVPVAMLLTALDEGCISVTWLLERRIHA